MPLKSGDGSKTMSDNISELMDSYIKTGSIGTSKPASKSKAQKQAIAIAYKKKGEGK